MIVTLIVKAVSACIRAIFSLLPTFTIPTIGTSAAGRFGAVVNKFLPVSDIVIVSLAIIAVLAAQRLFNFGVFVYHQFWGSS